MKFIKSEYHIHQEDLMPNLLIIRFEVTEKVSGNFVMNKIFMYRNQK